MRWLGPEQLFIAAIIDVLNNNSKQYDVSFFNKFKKYIILQYCCNIRRKKHIGVWCYWKIINFVVATSHHPCHCLWLFSFNSIPHHGLFISLLLNYLEKVSVHAELALSLTVFEKIACSPWCWKTDTTWVDWGIESDQIWPH